MDITVRQSRNYEENRRRRELQRRQRQRVRRIRAVKRGIVCVLSLAGILLIVTGIRKILPSGSGRAGKEAVLLHAENQAGEADGIIPGTSSQETLDIPYVDELTKLAEQDGRINQVIERAGEYPEKVLKMLAKNIETLDFVLDYWDKKDLPCADSIGQAPAEGEIPLLLQWDDRWGYGAYGSSMVAVSGCGPTCIAMVASGLTGRTDITPYTVAAYSENNGFLTKELDTSWDLMTYGCEEFGITGTMLGLDENAMANTLANGCPIICSVGPGDFTENGHFIVLTGYENGMFRVNDPNSRLRSEKTWSYDTLKDQIVNMWWYEAVQ